MPLICRVYEFSAMMPSEFLFPRHCPRHDGNTLLRRFDCGFDYRFPRSHLGDTIDSVTPQCVSGLAVNLGINLLSLYRG